MFAFFTFMVVTALEAQTGETENADVLRVGIHEYPPFVMTGNQGFHGFDIDYIQAIAFEMGKTVHFTLYPSSNSVLDAAKQGEVQLALGGLSLTEQREMASDFSHAYYQSGLSIMVKQENIPFIRSLLHALIDKTILLTFVAFLLFIFVSGVVFSICERRFGTKEGGRNNGIADGMWLTYATATTIGYGDVIPKSSLGRLLTVPISLIGFIVIGSISGVVSSLMTMDQLSQHIIDISDLKGKRVAYKESTASEQRILSHYAPAHAFETIGVKSSNEAYNMLKLGTVDAFIHDAPGLLYHAKNDSTGLVRVVGGMFDAQMYAIAVGKDTELQETIKRIQLRLQQDGVLDQLKHRYGI